MALNIAFLLFNSVAEMNFIAPWEVFSASANITKSGDRLSITQLKR